MTSSVPTPGSALVLRSASGLCLLLNVSISTHVSCRLEYLNFLKPAVANWVELRRAFPKRPVLHGSEAGLSQEELGSVEAGSKRPDALRAMPVVVVVDTEA